MKKNKDDSTVDYRIKSKFTMRNQYWISYFVLLVLSAGQWLIYSEYISFKAFPIEYIFGMLGYWAIVAGTFCLITHFQTKKKFDKPVKRLSKAAKEVAEGDFSVYIEPIHSPDKYDYIDVMFEDFNKMVAELGSIETMTNDFVANVSHEIKTPISIIQNYASALQQEELSDELRREYSKTIISASQRLNTLVENILKLNKLDNQEIIQVNESYDVCTQLCECALQFEDLWEEKNIVFIADIEDRATAMVDPGIMEIVWYNLLSNALKFTEQGGEIILKQTSDIDSITVTVSDTGCGMDDNTMKHIFDKFYQGDTSHSVEGNGLGLALSKRVVEKIGGSLTVTSELGKGSTFTVILPVGY